MKTLRIAILLAATALAAQSNIARADADDDAWINKCMRENSGASADVIRKYCSCMNNKMDDNEKKSVSNWEKTHPDEMKACEKEAGWK